MSEATNPETFTLTIDGRRVAARDGEYVLAAARRAGIEIPTLCEHEAVEPFGACRLCMVEVTKESWKGWKGLMTACLYPAAPDLIVETQSERVRHVRRNVLDLLLARCPDSRLIGKLAREHGVEQTSFVARENADLCILCGLCTRVCEAHATAAISTVSRGHQREIGTPGAFGPAGATWGGPPPDCVGCGACATLCPTGNIPVKQAGPRYEIWGRSFETPTCSVREERCLGCGACEEACPFSVARVVVREGASLAARIPAEHCRGCGACVGACPTGTIEQLAGASTATLYARVREPGPGRLAVVACSRSQLAGREIPGGTRLLEVPCTGRVTLPLLLKLMVFHDGVLVLGRHPESCRLGGAEAAGEERVARARALLDLIGVGAERLRFERAEPGPQGPLWTVQRFAEKIDRLGPSPLADRRRELPSLDGEGLAQALRVLGWMAGQPGLRPRTRLGGELGLPLAARGAPALFAGEALWIDLLAGSLIRPTSMKQVLRQGLDVLAALGVQGAGLSLEDAGAALHRLGGEEGGDGQSRSLRAMLASDGERLPRPPQGRCGVACDGSPASVELLETLGYRPILVGEDPMPPHLRLGAEDRRRAEEWLARAAREGAVALLAGSPLMLARWSLLTREGSWRSARVRPVLAHQLAWAQLRGLPIDRAATAPAEVTR